MKLVLTIGEARELLGEEAVGKSDAEVWAIHEALDQFAQVVVDVYRTRQSVTAGDAADRPQTGARSR